VSQNRKNNLTVGDRVITNNSCLGTVVRLDHDNFGDYIIVKLDLLKWHFAYEPWELEKVSVGVSKDLDRPEKVADKSIGNLQELV